MHSTDRRTFLKETAVAVAGGMLMPKALFGETAAPAAPVVTTTLATPAATLVVVHGTDIKKMLAAGIEKMGGWGAFVKAGHQVTLKPNIAWASTPEQGGNTSPALVAECIAACKTARAAGVTICENSCAPSEQTFKMSGVAEAAKKAGGRIYSPTAKQFRSVTLPRAKELKQADVAVDVMDCDCLINMPVAKVHGSAVITVSMKNWMGSVRDRGFWHRTNLHQCIADFSTFLKPKLIVVDATRILTTNGPQGPGNLEHPNQIVFGTDPVATDAYCATLFKKEPFKIPYIKMAHDMNVGCGDLAKVNVVHVEV